MATSQKNQPDRNDRPDQQSPGDKSGTQRDSRDREVPGENMGEQDAFNKNRIGKRSETFNEGRDDGDESGQIDRKKPKMSMEKDRDDEMDIEEADSENSDDDEADNERAADDREDDGSDSIPGKD